MKLDSMHSYATLTKTSPLTYNLIFSPPYSCDGHFWDPTMRITKGSTNSTQTYIFHADIINTDPVEDTGFTFTTQYVHVGAT
jgi:hypothetical protein